MIVNPFRCTVTESRNLTCHCPVNKMKKKKKKLKRIQFSLNVIRSTKKVGRDGIVLLF